MKKFRTMTALLLTLCFVFAMLPAFAIGADEQPEDRLVHSGITVDTDAAGGYEGDYVVIYNPATSSSTSYSTGTMTGLIETTAGTSSKQIAAPEGRDEFYRIDVDGLIAERERKELGDAYGKIDVKGGTRASYTVGSTKSFTISSYNPGSGTSLVFKVLAVGEHCYIWTPRDNVTNYYTLDSINADYAQQAADEFDRMYDLMNSSFGNHSNGTNGDGKVSLLFYNIDDGWAGSGGFVAGYFSSASYSYDGMPIINIDTYPGVYYKTTSGAEGSSMDIAYGTACHEYQHCINYSNTSGMSTWLNECFSAAAEEICYPGSSIVSRIQSWENYFYSDNNDWHNPPDEFAYTSALTLHKGFSMYNWNNNLEMDDTLALYAQVSFFAQYLYTRFGNSIYKQISNKFSSSEPTAITNATGVSCADLVRDFRVAVTANAAQTDYNGVYGFIPQADYDPSLYHDVENPYSLLAPVVFTGTSCSIKGGGAITVKPVNGVYNPPSGASSSLKYIGIKLVNYTVTAESNNTAYGTVSVNGTTITATPAAGYYVESCTLVSGEATWTISGNTIAVKPTSDCTIRVNFAPKPQYTVNFVASGTNEGSQTAYVNDSITLPNTVSVDPDGWTFIGWVDAQLAETTDEPTYYAPGASYTVTGNATLYALFTRVEDNGGTETVYELVTSAPSSWEGNYVITNNTTNLTTTGLYVFKGVTGSSSGTNVEAASNCTAFTGTGITMEGNTLKNVANDYVYTLAANGSYYTLRSASTGSYVGMNSSSYLYAYSNVNTSYCRWTPAVNASGLAQMKNAANGSYPYLGWSTSNTYFWSASTSNANVLRLWKENQTSTAINYYTTDPVVAQPTYYTVTFKDWNGTVLKTEEVLEGTAATAPADPTREGYTFTGWDVAFNNVTSDLVVTATYAINTYTVTFKDWDGTVLSTQTVEHGSAATAPADPTRDGYTFAGWDVAFNNVTSDLVVTATYTENETPAGLLGDVNCDGKVDMGDISALSAYLLGKGELTAQGLANADASLNGAVDSSDLSAIFALI